MLKKSRNHYGSSMQQSQASVHVLLDEGPVRRGGRKKIPALKVSSPSFYAVTIHIPYTRSFPVLYNIPSFCLGGFIVGVKGIIPAAVLPAARRCGRYIPSCTRVANL